MALKKFKTYVVYRKIRIILLFSIRIAGIILYKMDILVYGWFNRHVLLMH